MFSFFMVKSPGSDYMEAWCSSREILSDENGLANITLHDIKIQGSEVSDLYYSLRVFNGEDPKW